MNNFDRYSTKDGIKYLIDIAVSSAEDCSVCKRLGLVPDDCSQCIVSVAGFRGGLFDKTVDAWFEKDASEFCEWVLEGCAYKTSCGTTSNRGCGAYRYCPYCGKKVFRKTE